MMEQQILRIMLLVYFITYFGFTFILKSWLTAKKIGKNPIMLPTDDSAYALVGNYFKLTLISIFIYVLLYTILPQSCFIILAFDLIHGVFSFYTGWGLLLFALIWTMKAQSDMRNSWRIGIDRETPTELIKAGLFGISRNPVFLGMLISLTGLFLVSPDTFTILFLVTGGVLIQVQIRLEEAHMCKMHGDTYEQYKLAVPRFI